MDNLDGLNGRALDAAIARYLFELEVEERENRTTREKDAVCRKPGQQWVRVASYTVGMGASLNIEYALSKRGWTWRQELRAASRWSQPGVGQVVLVHSDGRTVEAEGITLNEALCRAALKAVWVQEESA